MAASARIMWERHPDFRVAKLPNADWRIKVISDRAKEWCNKHLTFPVPCTIEGDLLLTSEQAVRLGRGALDEGFELGDWQ